MGKKKPQKTKELSVAIAEASSTKDEMGQRHQLEQQPQTQQQAPRKRGRPRKIILKMESEDEKAQGIGGATQATTESTSMEKGTTNEELEGASSSACIRINTNQEEIQLPKGEPSRSRARRKSKPRKSS